MAFQECSPQFWAHSKCYFRLWVSSKASGMGIKGPLSKKCSGQGAKEVFELQGLNSWFTCHEATLGASPGVQPLAWAHRSDEMPGCRQAPQRLWCPLRWTPGVRLWWWLGLGELREEMPWGLGPGAQGPRCSC